MAVSSGRRRAPDRMRSAFRGVRRAIRALDDHWIGDVLGVISLFVLLWMGLLAAAVLG